MHPTGSSIDFGRHARDHLSAAVKVSLVSVVGVGVAILAATQQLSNYGRNESARMETSLCKTVCLFPDFGKKFVRYTRRLTPGSVLALQLLQASLFSMRNSR